MSLPLMPEMTENQTLHSAPSELKATVFMLHQRNHLKDITQLFKNIYLHLL